LKNTVYAKISNVSETRIIKTRIYSNNLYIGKGLLKNTLSGMGAMFGEFVPNENYSQVKKEIQQWHKLQNDDYCQKWRELRFNAQLETGYFLFAIGCFEIGDVEELPDETLEVMMAGVLPCVFEHSRDAEPFDSTFKERRFLSEPWQKISIEEKIRFEDELEKEIGSTRSYIPAIFKQKNNHLLAKTEFSALAKNSENDDVIFAIHGEAKGFIAVVNLTWSGKKEKDSRFPLTNLYQSLDEINE
jgi:hypothetical protein